MHKTTLRRLTILGLLSLLTGPAFAKGSVPRLFDPALRQLAQVALPVLLPTEFGEVDLRHDKLFIKTEVTTHHYELQINYSSDCNGANVCSAGGISAADALYRRIHATDWYGMATPQKPDAEERERIRAGELILDKPVRLFGGLTGWYTEAHSGADDGGNSSLRWISHGIVYSIVTRISDQATLVKIADSALRNGPLLFPGAHSKPL